MEDIKTMDENGQLQRKLDRAILKDTVNVPNNGYTIIRFVADNPGEPNPNLFFVTHTSVNNIYKIIKL